MQQTGVVPGVHTALTTAIRMRIKAYVDASVPARAEVFLGARMQRRKSANLYGTSVEQDASACANGRSATAEKPRASRHGRRWQDPESRRQSKGRLRGQVAVSLAGHDPGAASAEKRNRTVKARDGSPSYRWR